MKDRIDGLNAKIAELQKLVDGHAAIATERDTLQATLSATTERHAVDMALIRHGITDPEDMSEFRDRYGRAEPDAKGARPDPAGWMKGIVEAKPKWARAYLPEPAESAAPPVVKPPPVVTPPPGGNPNGGAGPAGPGPRKQWTDEVVDRLTPAELKANMPAILAEMAADGVISYKPPAAKTA